MARRGTLARLAAALLLTASLGRARATHHALPDDAAEAQDLAFVREELVVRRSVLVVLFHAHVHGAAAGLANGWVVP